jgi:citrate lyase subunit beta/citryl-CoA lyase
MTISYKQHVLRSLLFVPADDDRKMKKAALSGADAIICDLEDSIVPERKSFARAGCTRDNFSHGQSVLRLVRINPLGTEWFEEDLRCLSEIRPDGVVIPKCETVDAVRVVAEAFQTHPWSQSLRLYLMIESALGLIRAEQTAISSEYVVAMAFGAEDFCASIGIEGAAGGSELTYARCRMVTVAKAFGLNAIDSPTVILDDPDVVRTDAERARGIGFTGKLAIHPQQIPALNAIFGPSLKELQWAREVLEEAGGRGVFLWKGRMVDEAVLRRARSIVEVHARLAEDQRQRSV